MTSTPNIMW